MEMFVNGLTCTDLRKYDDFHDVETTFTAVKEPATESSDDDQKDVDDETRSFNYMLVVMTKYKRVSFFINHYYIKYNLRVFCIEKLRQWARSWG